MSKYNVVMEMKNATVVSEYEPEKKRSDAYQSESALEKEFIRMLTEQGYEYLTINDSDALVKNLRTQLELLNDNIVIERITGDPIKEELIVPNWLLKKFCVLNEIDKEMVRRNTYQGKKNVDK